MAPVPSERALFASYKLWRKHADPDGLISASEFAEMDEDDKREALRELGGAVADAGGSDEEEEEEEESGVATGKSDEDDDEEEPLPKEELDDDDDDDPLAGDVVELTEDIIDERTKDPFG